MVQAGLASKACIFGGDQALAKQTACFRVGTENALTDLALSSVSLSSRAFWFVLTVVTHELVASENKTVDGSNSRGRSDRASSSFVVTLWHLNNMSITLLVLRIITLLVFLAIELGWNDCKRILPELALSDTAAKDSELIPVSKDPWMDSAVGAAFVSIGEATKCELAF